MPNDNETVTLKTNNGNIDFIVPAGMSDAEIKNFVLSKRPDLFADIKTGQGMEAQAAQQAHRMFTGSGGQGSYNAQGLQVSGPNGEPLTLMEKAAQAQGLQQSQLGAAINRASNSTTPVANAAALYAPVAAVKTIIGSKLGSKAGEAVASAIDPELKPYGSLAGGILGGVSANLSTPSRMKAQAGATFSNIKQTAGDTPVDTTPFSDTLLELYGTNQTAGGVPRVATRLFQRLTAPNAEPLTYAEAKQFQSAVSNLSASEKMAANPNVQRLMGQLNAGMKTSLEQASQQGGMAPGTFTGAMQQYHRASQVQDMIDWIKDLSLKGIAQKTALGGAGYGAVKAAEKVMK